MLKSEDPIHEFNNLLNIMGGNMHFLRERCEETDQDTIEIIDDVISAILDATELVDGLRALLRATKEQELQTLRTGHDQ